jgi:hypothetical protein
MQRCLQVVYGPKVKGTFAIGPGLLTTGIDYYNRNWDYQRIAMTGYKNGHDSGRFYG